jgi:hypothetical protein
MKEGGEQAAEASAVNVGHHLHVLVVQFVRSLDTIYWRNRPTMMTI